MSRYSDVKKGPELAAQLTAYQAYLAKTQAQKRADYAALNVSRVISARTKSPIRPFGTTNLLIPMLTPIEGGNPDTTGTTAEQREQDAALVTALRGLLTGRIEITKGETDQVVPLPKFKAAKLHLTRNTGGTPIEATSRFTGRTYKRRSKNTLSSPFGKGATATETEEAAIAAIMGNPALNTFLQSTSGNSYRIEKQLTIIAA